VFDSFSCIPVLNSIIFGTEITKTDIFITHFFLIVAFSFRTVNDVILRIQFIHKRHAAMTSFRARDLSNMGSDMQE
jgi:hypothetical protein